MDECKALALGASTASTASIHPHSALATAAEALGAKADSLARESSKENSGVDNGAATDVVGDTTRGVRIQPMGGVGAGVR